HYTAGCLKYREDCRDCLQLRDNRQQIPFHILNNKLKHRYDNLTIVTPSRWLAGCASASKLFNGLRVETIPNSVETDIFKPLEKRTAKKELGLAPGQIALLFGTHIENEKRKGFSNLLEALRYCLQDPNFIRLAKSGGIKILTFGPPQGDLRKLGIKFQSFGSIAEKDKLALLYAAADLFVLPSLEDNLPNTMLESMACGTPVIGFAVGGMPDLIQNGMTGGLAPCFDNKKFAELILDLVFAAAKREQMGRNCRHLIEEKFKLQDQAANYLELFNDLSKHNNSEGGETMFSSQYKEISLTEWTPFLPGGEGIFEVYRKSALNLLKFLNSNTYRAWKIIARSVRVTEKLISKITGKLSRLFRRIPTRLVNHFNRFEKKINLGDQLEANYGRHRSGLKYGLSYLTNLHNPNGIVFDAFIERTFCWHPGGIKPHTKPWIGFIHVPPHVPAWFISGQANEKIFKTKAWQESLSLCRGLFVFSNYHKVNLEKKLDIPVNNLLFPTEIPNIQWTWDKFQANQEKKIIQVGWWLRKLHAIYQLPQTRYTKIFLNVEHECVPTLMQIEKNILMKEGTFHEGMYETVETIRFLPDNEYDRLLCENIVFIYLYDASANNTVTECIARNTPILINPIEPVKEYLGEDYPFYYHSLAEAAEKAQDLDLVLKTHRFLVNHPVKKKLTGAYFRQSFVNSQIYKSLKIK
ncbi:MAG TPA: glycosyltransferase, partial [Candidatus Kapabacteria bacterium]|nr:glycosyltransferase [Candidatus Kapabacteria bacterium]